MALNKTTFARKPLRMSKSHSTVLRERWFLNTASQETPRSSRCPNIPAVPSISVRDPRHLECTGMRTDMTQYGHILLHAPAGSVVFKVASCKNGALHGKRNAMSLRAPLQTESVVSANKLLHASRPPVVENNKEDPHCSCILTGSHRTLGSLVH